MAKEQVQIVFSANSEQARALYNEIAQGQDKVARKSQAVNKELAITNRSIDGIALATAAASKSFDLLTNAISGTIEKQKEYNRLARDRAEGGQSLAIEGGLSSRQEAAINASIDAVAKSRAAPNREFVRQIAEELLQVGMTPEQITGGGLNSSLKILQGFNEAKAGGSGTQLTRQLITNMQNLGIAVTPENMERAAVQFNEIKQLTGLEFGPASNILESMARVSKSPRSVKALGGLGLTPEQIDPARAGIPGAMQALFGATAGMADNERNAMFARLFGGDEATGLSRMFARRRDIRGGDFAGFERDAARAVSGSAADARRADIGIENAAAAKGNDFDILLAQIREMHLRSGVGPFWTASQEFAYRAAEAVRPGFGRTSAIGALTEMGASQEMGPDGTFRMVLPKSDAEKKQEVIIKLPNQTRVPGVIKATENLEGMMKSAAGMGGGLN